MRLIEQLKLKDLANVTVVVCGNKVCVRVWVVAGLMAWLSRWSVARFRLAWKFALFHCVGDSDVVNIVLMAQVDKTPRQVTTAEAQLWAGERGFHYFEASAMSGTCV